MYPNMNFMGEIMDYEDFLAYTYTPLKSIESLTNIIYEKSNNEWDLFAGNTDRKSAEELLALNFAIKLAAKYLLSLRKNEIENLVL